MGFRWLHGCKADFAHGTTRVLQGVLDLWFGGRRHLESDRLHHEKTP